MDNLLDGLVADMKPVRRRSVTMEALVLVGLVAIELAVWLLMGNARENLIHVVQTTPVFWWKLGGAAVLMTIGCATAVASFDPAASPRRGLAVLGGMFGVFLAIAFVLDAKQGFADLAARLSLWPGLICFAHIVPLSVPPLAALALLMRRGAPTDTAATSIACGLAAAGWGAFVFVFSCPHDDPLFVAVWYPATAAASALFARLVLPPISRW